MKNCPNCGQAHTDDMMYCTVCGCKLNCPPTQNPYSAYTAQNAPSVYPGANGTTGTAGKGVKLAAILSWLPYVLALLGLFIAWHLSGLVGIVLSAVAIGVAIVTRASAKVPFLAIGVSVLSVIIELVWFVIALS